jgi:hypothetical protein
MFLKKLTMALLAALTLVPLVGVGANGALSPTAPSVTQPAEVALYGPFPSKADAQACGAQYYYNPNGEVIAFGVQNTWLTLTWRDGAVPRPVNYRGLVYPIKG